jgi:hypothetical protein
LRYLTRETAGAASPLKQSEGNDKKRGDQQNEQ